MLIWDIKYFPDFFDKPSAALTKSLDDFIELCEVVINVPDVEYVIIIFHIKLIIVFVYFDATVILLIDILFLKILVLLFLLFLLLFVGLDFRDIEQIILQIHPELSFVRSGLFQYIKIVLFLFGNSALVPFTYNFHSTITL